MGVATTMAIVGAASIASQAVAAKKASTAAKKAAAIQAESGRQAIGAGQDMYRQQFQMQSPYMALGNSAAGTLGRLMGAPAGGRYASPPLQQPQMGMSPMMGPGGGMGGPQMGMGGPPGMAMPRQPPMGMPPQMQGPQPMPGMGMRPMQQMPQGGRFGDLAMMR